MTFDPQVFAAVEKHQKNLLKELERPVSFSEALNELLKAALEAVGVLKHLEDVEKTGKRGPDDCGRSLF